MAEQQYWDAYKIVTKKDLTTTLIQPNIDGVVPCCGPTEKALQGANCFDAGLFWNNLFHDQPS
jgi:hypothetical protein